MYYSISGTLVTTEPNAAIVDNNGIAYRMTVSGTTLAKLSSKLGAQVKLFTYLNVYQDGLDLYGFWSQEELSSFKLLISVSGIGPKAAMSILSQMTPEKLAVAVSCGDTKMISRAPGVGAKTAARIVLELKDKLAMQVSDADASDVHSSAGSGNADAPADAMNALLVLGYSRGEASEALRGIDKSLSVEDMITAALKKLMRS